MSQNSMKSVFYGLLFGVAPGVLIGLIGLSLGGEWAWNLGLLAIWLIFFGFFAGPLLGSVGPEIVAERPVISGALIGVIPGVVFTAMRFEEVGWACVLAILGGSALGALVGHQVALRSRAGRPRPLGTRSHRFG